MGRHMSDPVEPGGGEGDAAMGTCQAGTRCHDTLETCRRPAKAFEKAKGRAGAAESDQAALGMKGSERWGWASPTPPGDDGWRPCNPITSAQPQQRPF